MRRVVITGASAVTPIGLSRSDILDGLRGGRSGVAPLRPDDPLAAILSCHVYGALPGPIPSEFVRKYKKTMGPVCHYACHVAKEAIAQSGLEPGFVSSGDMGVSFSSTQGSPSVAREVYQAFLAQSRPVVTRLHPAAYLQSMTHTTAANIARMFSITGRTIASSTACTTGTQAIGFGYEAVKFGLQDAMICGAADEYDTTALAVFDHLLVASNAFNSTPHRTPRPFDADRDGLVVGEGAAALVLEELAHAKARGADILAEIAGFGTTNNGGDLILPSRASIERTIRAGLANARLAADELDYISAHGTATQVGDIAEAEAIGAVYGLRPAVTAFKSYMGHTMAACGAIETVLTLYAMQLGCAFPTLNLDRVDERCAMARHARTLLEQAIRVASVQSFALGGVNAVLFLKAYS